MTYDQCCPTRKKVYPAKQIKKPWMDHDLITLCKRKNNLYNLYRQGVVSYDIFTNFRNELTSTIRKCKSNYFRDKFECCRNDIRKTFSCINGLIGCKTKKVISEILNDGNSYTVSSSIAALFSNYFYSVPINLRNQILPCNNDTYKLFLGSPVPDHMEFVTASHDEVSNTINSLQNKSCRLDSIPVFVFKFLNVILSPIICKLFNSSILEGNFPQILKNAVVVPIHKSGSKSTLSNYRPISLLSTLSKIFEKLMCTRLKHHLSLNNILNDNQFGFRANNSTSDAIIQFLNECYNSINSKNHIISVFLDLSKAFDTLA